MNIAFIVSSAEPGRDGMGDYTLSLAGALRAKGHGVLVIALNDRWLSSQHAATTEEDIRGVRINRLSSHMMWGERIAQASAILHEYRPDWTSFQLVNYGYNRKGILYGFNRRIDKLRDACENWQVMFQELWVGLERGAPWKHRIVGVLQRHALVQFVRTLRPRLLQTSTPFFRAALGVLGFDASVLPLAGSIPVNSHPGSEWFVEVLRNAYPSITAGTRQKYLAGGFFGSIYEQWEPEPFFSTLRSVVQKTGQKVCILSAGRLAAGETKWDRLSSMYPDFCFLKLGELPTDRVSQYLQNLDFGIAASPWLLIGKSSATAAMLDHGLPVMVTRNDAHPSQRISIESPSDPLLILADRDISSDFFSDLPRREPRNSAENLAAEFIRQMEYSLDTSPNTGYVQNTR